MGGANCAIVGCPAQKSKHKGLTFHKLPAKGTNDEWRMQLINSINRQDKSFNPDRAAICSRHFKDSCFKTGPGGKLRRLIEGSLPTEYMPVRTIETPKPTERKPPMQREPPPPETQRVCYFTLKDLRKDSTRLPAPWTRLEDEENYISVGIIDRFTVKIHVSISSDLSSTVHVLGLPAANLSRHLEQVRLHTYLQELSTLNACTGVTNPELQDFSTSPPIAGVTDKHYLHRTHYYDCEQNNHCSKTCVRSADCLLLSDNILCKNCEAVEKRLTKQLQMSKATAARPLHAHDPLRTASKDKLKIALKAARLRERKLQKEVELFKKKLNTDSVPVSKELHDSMTSVLEQQLPSDPLARMFWEEQAKAFKTKGEKGMKWHPMMIRLALLLHSRGRAAYNTLRDTGVLKLPGESTLRDYTNCIHPTEGFHPEVLEEIKSAAKHLPACERFVVLLHDEMSIKEDLVFDSKTDELVGFVNISQWKERPNCHTVFASHVLVFCVVGVNSSLKMSMGYFGTRTATADQIYPLFWEAVGHLEETCQLKVIASTSDKAPPNQHLYQLHGRANEIFHKTLNFFAPDRYIYFFSDVPHLVKTVRNNLYRSGYGKPVLLWNNGKELMWQQIKDVYSGESARGLARTKLTCDHVYLTAHSMMNVKLAAQVLSNRVGRVLEVHGGDGSSETARFILLMDRFFDCLNVRSFDDAREKRKDDLKPYTRGDDPRFQFLHDFLTYLENWKESVRTRPGNFSAADRAKMFLTLQTYKGLVTTIKSFNEVAQYLLQHGVRFILSNKFCQDPIEAHFGRHRGISQRSENPNLYAFGYQENKIRLQRTLALTLQPKGNVETGKRPHTEITISNSPLKKKKTN